MQGKAPKAHKQNICSLIRVYWDRLCSK